ncbi:MAG TPA: DUF885 domain-containing protein [Thermoanaerobaculia bacterium]
MKTILAPRIGSAMAGAAILLLMSVDAPPALAQDAGARLHALFDEEWEHRLRENPLFATSVGDHRFNDRLPAVSIADEARQAEFDRRLLARLKEIDPKALSEADRVSWEMFEWRLTDAIGGYEHKTYMLPLTADSGFHTELARLPENAPLATAKDYENYIARLNAIPRYMEQWIALLREARKAGYGLPRAVLDGYERSIASQVVADPETSVFFKPFKEFPASVPEADRGRLRTAGREAVANGPIPGYRALLDYMTKEYIPGARQTLGASEMPGGRALYAYLIRHFTTLDMTADQVHELGLSEVKRIRAEMDAVIAKTGFSGDFAAFLEFLRTDPRFYPKTAEELLKQAAYLAKKMDGKLPLLFGRLPRQPYGVEAVPDDIAPKYTAGRYVGAPLDSKRAGRYWVNTYALSSRSLYNLEALTLHEAVPGHHLQTSLAQERTGLHPFRRFTYVDAFGEGWGLYSEFLGREAGFYRDPYSNFGRLTYEMWRACRLVVDTGMHAMGWSRDRALQYLADNTALSRHEITTEIDRYIGWPGQALAYKTGELKIRELRRRAEQALGPRFDVREFHDAVLRNGSVPLSVLETQIDDYVAAAKAAAARGQ